MPERQSVEAGPGAAAGRPMPPYLIAAAAGACLWIAASVLSDQREAWDSSGYWTLAYPLGVAIVAVLAFVWPHRGAWGVGLTFMLAQAVTLALMARSFSLLPLGLILFGFLSLPLAGAAALASWLRLGGRPDA